MLALLRAVYRCDQNVRFLFMLRQRKCASLTAVALCICLKDDHSDKCEPTCRESHETCGGEACGGQHLQLQSHLFIMTMFKYGLLIICCN